MSGKIDRRNRRLIAATLMLVIALAGCTASTRIEPGVTWVNPGEQRIVFTAAGFKTTRPIRVKYTDLWQTEEYALFKADGRQLEIIYAGASRAFTVALNYQMPIDAMVATWNLNSQPELVWGPLGRIDNRFGTWFYRNYEHSDLQRSCVGFMVESDSVSIALSCIRIISSVRINLLALSGNVIQEIGTGVSYLIEAINQRLHAFAEFHTSFKGGIRSSVLHLIHITRSQNQNIDVTAVSHISVN